MDGIVVLGVDLVGAWNIQGMVQLCFCSHFATRDNFRKLEILYLKAKNQYTCHIK